MMPTAPPHPATRRHWIALLAIVLAAGAMRFADLEHCPNGLFRDEAEKGYNAWALATTGGALDLSPTPAGGVAPRARRAPWTIDVMGVKTSALYQYASVPFVALGGLRVGTTRMAAAAAGTLAVALAGWVFMCAWGAWRGLAVALGLALAPWHVLLSRWALQGAFVPLLTAGALGGMLGIERGRRWGWPVFGAALGWLAYAYSGAQPFVAAWGVGWVVLERRRFRFSSVWLWLGAALFLLPLAPRLAVQLAPGGSARLAQTAVWGEPGLGPWGVAGRCALNYGLHLDPRFLFWRGDVQPRHCMPGLGQLTWLDAAMAPLGLIWLWRGGRKPLAGAVTLALLCGPIPAALTREGLPHGLRAIGMLLPAVALSGAGLATALDRLRARLVHTGWGPRARAAALGLVVVGVVASGLSLYARYRRVYRRSPLARVAFESGHRGAWERLAAERRSDERVWIDGRILYAPWFQLFFTQRPPSDVARRGLEADGVHYFLPTPHTPDWPDARMQPGDWALRPVHPLSIDFGDEPLHAQDAARIREAWVAAIQKPLSENSAVARKPLRFSP